MRATAFVALLFVGLSATVAGQVDKPLARSIAGEAARAAVTPATVEDPARLDSNTAGRFDWSHLMSVEGEEIVLSLRNAQPGQLHGTPSGRRTVVRGTVTDRGLTILNLSDPVIPSAARRALAAAASTHPEYFSTQAGRQNVPLNEHVRLEGGAVFVNDRRVIGLEQVIERVDRTQVVEISRVHRAAKRGMGWGGLVGAGAAVVTGFAACGTHWNTETSTCGNVTGAVLIAYPLLGVVSGAIIGALIETTTVVYRAP